MDGAPSDADLEGIRKGIVIKGKKGNTKTRPGSAKIISHPGLAERDPPVRFRKSIPTTWLEIIIHEGMNRQVRRMCAAIGFPCLRLVRVQVGKYRLTDLNCGQWREVSKDEIISL